MQDISQKKEKLPTKSASVTEKYLWEETQFKTEDSTITSISCKTLDRFEDYFISSIMSLGN